LRVVRFIAAWVLLFVTCALITFEFNAQSIVEFDLQLTASMLVVSTLGAYLFSGVSLKGSGSDPINPKVWAYMVAHTLVLLVKSIAASLDVASRVLRPGPPVKPGIVRVPTQVRKDWGVTLLSNSITLTPGTMVVDVDERRRDLYVHWINVKEKKPEAASEKVSGAYERILRRAAKL
jgi:multicomponent Na+:H+ antiporter subunit E